MDGWISRVDGWIGRWVGGWVGGHVDGWRWVEMGGDGWLNYFQDFFQISNCLFSILNILS